MGQDWHWRREPVLDVDKQFLLSFPIICVKSEGETLFVIDGYRRYFYAQFHQLKCLFTCIDSFSIDSLRLFVEHQLYASRFDLRDVASLCFSLKQRGYSFEEILLFWKTTSFCLDMRRSHIESLLFFYAHQDCSFPFLLWQFSIMEVREILSWSDSVVLFLLEVFNKFSFTFSQKRNLVRLFRHIHLDSIDPVLIEARLLVQTCPSEQRKECYELLFSYISSVVFPHYSQIRKELDFIKAKLPSYCQVLSRPGYENGSLLLQIQLSHFSNMSELMSVCEKYRLEIEKLLNVL